MTRKVEYRTPTLALALAAIVAGSSAALAVGLLVLLWLRVN